MDRIKNPYRPGAGTAPKYLAGRDEVVEEGRVLFGRVAHGNPQRSIMLYGLRGVGKTVLLVEIEKHARANGFFAFHIEMSENDTFSKVIGGYARQALLKISGLQNAKDKVRRALGVLRAFTFTFQGAELNIDVDKIVGEGDSGDLESDLTDLLVNLGEAARETSQMVAFFIDETQYLDEASYAALIAATHRISQLELPVVFVCAGLPQIAALSGDAKSYAERLYNYIPIAQLEPEEARKALEQPALEEGVEYTEEATQRIIKLTQGYPYFLQEFGSTAWDVAIESPIGIDVVEACIPKTLARLDDSFFKVRFDRAKGAERKMMFAMADLGKGPYQMSDVAEQLGNKVQSLSPTRAMLIRKGFIYTPRHGYIAFTVPLFDEFLVRCTDEYSDRGSSTILTA